MSNNSSIIKAYKGFNKDMTCKDFQYEEGKEYEIEGELCMCHNGFHAYEKPLDTFLYYPHNNSCVYHEVELSGDIIRNYEDSKLCASKIKIGRRLDVINDILEPNIDTDTEVVNKGNLSIYITNIAGKPGNITKRYNDLCKGAIGSYLELYDSYTNNTIILKVDGNRIKDYCYYRYYDGKIEEYNI